METFDENQWGSDVSLQAWKDEKERADSLEQELIVASQIVSEAHEKLGRIGVLVEDTGRPFCELRAVLCAVKMIVRGLPDIVKKGIDAIP